MAPTPGPGGTDVHLPDPRNVDPSTILGSDLFWKFVAAFIIVAVGAYIINKLPWKPIGIVAIIIILFIIFAPK